MKLLNSINKVYYNMGIINDREMKVSRKISIFEGCTARSILTLTSGAFLVGFAKYLGASNQIAGIISAIPVLGGIITAFSPLLYERMENRKFITCFFCFIGRLLLGLMILIPFIKTSHLVQISLLVGIFLIANLFLSFTLPASQTWILNITPAKIRGAYFGHRESIILGAVTVVTLLAGQILDKFEKLGQQLQGFVILYIFVICAAIANFILFSSIKEPCNKLSAKRVSIKNLFTIPLKNSKYMLVVWLMVMWNVGFQISAPFTTVYMVSSLKLGYGLITVLSVLTSITSVVSVRLWGRLADKKSWLYLMKIMIILQIACFFVWFFINRQTLFLLPISHILGGAAISGVNISVNNIQYSYSPEENKTIYMGFSSAVNGVFGFCGTLVGAFIVKKTDALSINVAGFSIGNMQTVFLIAGVSLIICIFLIRMLDVERYHK
ncbi:MAG TPA: MFS transporter [Ruminiclostridium sp.]|nr:MFS transporter [Ruminiclostridium sp.]